MKEHYVTYEQADKLKNLGFDWECRYYYNTNTKDFRRDRSKYNYNLDYIRCSAPRLDQAQAWLREVQGIDIEINVFHCKHREYRPIVLSNEDGIVLRPYSTYDLALSAGIDKALELLTNKS